MNSSISLTLYVKALALFPKAIVGTPQGLKHPRVLCDFNAMRFEPIAAPY